MLMHDGGQVRAKKISKVNNPHKCKIYLELFFSPHRVLSEKNCGESAHSKNQFPVSAGFKSGVK